MLALMFVFSACKKDDDDPVVPPVLIEDGVYLKGEATPYTELNTKSMLAVGKNEVGQVERTGMYEKYSSLKAGSNFNIVEVAGTTQTNYGPATNESVILAGENDQIHATIQKGTLGTSGNFTVPADGMYHIIIDKTTNTYIIAPVTKWAIIGGVTELGWSDTDLPLVGAFDANSMKWEATGLTLRSGNFKFRYSGGWKLEIDSAEVKANTNFGGVTEGTLPNLSTTLVPGGADYLLTGEQEGVYTVTITWTPNDGYKSSLVKTGEVEPLNYPETLYMIGDAVGDWVWENTDLPMIPVHSKPHLFWKIVWMSGDPITGFKFAPAKEWAGDFGKTGEMENDIYAKGADNIPSPATAGYYMVTVNFETEQIAITQPMVYLIGDAIGTWDLTAEGFMFTVDNANEKLTITKDLVAAKNLRMYAWMDKGWFTDWWQSEFNIFNGVIEYRGTGNDQAPVVTIGGSTTIDLNFKTNTGSVTP